MEGQANWRQAKQCFEAAARDELSDGRLEFPGKSQAEDDSSPHSTARTVQD